MEEEARATGDFLRGKLNSAAALECDNQIKKKIYGYNRQSFSTSPPFFFFWFARRFLYLFSTRWSGTITANSVAVL